MPPGRWRSVPSGRQRVDVVAHALDEVAVVADDHERARPRVEEVLERRERVDVEVVRRLVEDEHVRPLDEQPHEREPPALAAGEVADERPALLAAEAEALREHPRGELVAVGERRAAADLLDRLEHAAGGRARPPCPGRGTRGARSRRAAPRRASGSQVAGEQPHERRLARAVHADERDPVARAEPPRDAVQQPPLAEGQRDVLGLEHLVAQPGATRSAGARRRRRAARARRR